MARDVVTGIGRATRREFRAEDKIRIVLEGLRGEIFRFSTMPLGEYLTGLALSMVQSLLGGEKERPDG